MSLADWAMFVVAAAAAIAAIAVIPRQPRTRFQAPLVVVCVVLVVAASVMAGMSTSEPAATGTDDAGESVSPAQPTTTESPAAPITTDPTTDPTTTDPTTEDTTTEESALPDLDGENLELFRSLHSDAGGFDPESCEEGSASNSAAEFDAIIVCDAYGLDDVLRISKMTDDASYQEYLSFMVGDIPPGSGSCATEPDIWLNWTHDDVVVGELICDYLDEKHWLQWCSPDTLVVGQVSGTDKTALYDWWTSHADIVPWKVS